jgi:hypothetical protein
MTAATKPPASQTNAMKPSSTLGNSRRLTIAALALWAAIIPASARTVHWGTSLLDILVKSDGTAIAAADGFTFELGVFDSTFVPLPANTGSWLANWRPLDASGYNETAGYFSSSFELTPDPAGGVDGTGAPLGVSSSSEAYAGYKVATGSQLYFMVYNNTSMDPTTELFLGGAGTWTIPVVDNNQTSPVVNFRLSQLLGTPVFGGSNDTFGNGERSTVPGAYALQTATFAVPEPSSAILLGTLLLLRRRRTGS